MKVYLLKACYNFSGEATIAIYKDKQKAEEMKDALTVWISGEKKVNYDDVDFEDDFNAWVAAYPCAHLDGNTQFADFYSVEEVEVIE